MTNTEAMADRSFDNSEEKGDHLKSVNKQVRDNALQEIVQEWQPIFDRLAKT